MSFNYHDDVEMQSSNSGERMSVASSTTVAIVHDQILIQLNEMDKQNARIKKKL